MHLWDRVHLDGAAVTLDRAQRDEVEDFVGNWYVRHVALDSGRSSTWTSGLGVARMVSALAYGEAGPWPASVVLDGEYGISGVSLSVPVSLGPNGVAEIHEWSCRRRSRRDFGRRPPTCTTRWRRSPPTDRSAEDLDGQRAEPAGDDHDRHRQRPIRAGDPHKWRDQRSHPELTGAEQRGSAAHLVEALVEVGAQDEAIAVTARLRELSEQQQHPWGRASARRCEAVVQLATRPYDERAARALAGAAEDYARLGLRFDCARSLLSLGRAERRFKKWGPAREALQGAIALFEVWARPAGRSVRVRNWIASVRDGRGQAASSRRASERSSSWLPAGERTRRSLRHCRSPFTPSRCTCRVHTPGWACAHARSSRAGSTSGHSGPQSVRFP